MSNPASAIASLAACTASCEKRPMRLASRRSMSPLAVGSKSWTSPETLQGNGVGSMSDMRRTPETPSLRLCQNSSGDLPRHVIAPIPVITALRLSSKRLIGNRSWMLWFRKLRIGRRN